MAEFISKAAIVAHIEEQSREWGEEYDAEQILGDIEDFPVADVVEVVRCKDCRCHDPEDKKCDCGGLRLLGALRIEVRSFALHRNTCCARNVHIKFLGNDCHSGIPEHVRA